MNKKSLSLILSGFIGMFLGVWGLVFLSAGEIYDYQDTLDGALLPQVDAIVCLAGGRGRIAASGDVWYRYWELSQKDKGFKLPILYISGMGQNSGWNVLARQLRPGVLKVLSPKDVILETESSNTDANARYLGRKSKERGWQRILLMTSRYHMRRARLIFGRILKFMQLPIEVETLSVYQEPFEPGEWREGLNGIRVTMMEYMKWLYYKTLWNPEKA